MKKMLFLTLLLGFATPSVHALSIAYDDFLCDTKGNPLGERGTSRFEVISYQLDGMYKIEITGGVPNLDDPHCIDTNLGQEKKGGVDNPFTPSTSVTGTAYFDGLTLIVSVNFVSLIFTADVGTIEVITNIIVRTKQYHFDYNENDATFVLRNGVNDGKIVVRLTGERLIPVYADPTYTRADESVIYRIVE